MLFLRTWRSACTCCGYHVCSFDPCIALCLDEKVRTTKITLENTEKKEFWRRQLLMPQLLAAAALLGMFHWTNYWDFVIYYTVTCGVILIMNIIGQEGKVKWILAVTAAQAAEILILATLIILPFTMQFDSSNMVQGIALAQHHSLPHQLLVLWACRRS